MGVVFFVRLMLCVNRFCGCRMGISLVVICWVVLVRCFGSLLVWFVVIVRF